MKTNHHTTFVRVSGAFILVAALLVQTFQATSVSAAQITNRKLTLEAGATDGGSKPGGIVKHRFDFTVAGGSVGSIKFQYCTTAAPVVNGLDCTVPTGLDTTTAVLGNESGATGFTGIDKSTNGTVIISRAAASAVSGGALSYRLDSVKNPTIETTFFVRISTHTSLNATDATPVDSGTVTAATAEQVILDGTMPESLVFCAGATIPVNAGGVPDCALATSGVISFNQLFSPTDTATAKSEMAASTNAGTGYVITVNGPTLTSGANTITPIGATGPGIRGVSQFGLNLRANTTATSTPAIGSEIAVPSNGTNYRAQPTADYGTIDNFKYVSGDAVGNSSSVGSDAQIFTASYMVNVPGSQPAGTYTTTLTYICTPTF